MKTLKLTLNKQWFDLIEKGIKTEEYREIKSYWFTRLVFDYKKVLSYIGSLYCCLEEDIKRICEDAFWSKTIGFIHFDLVEFTNGYNKKSPKITFEVYKIEISTGKVEWGAGLNKPYFTIKLGREVSRQNC